jgi:glycosyltransferase involved in cell wall biosynthesis
MSDRDIQPRRLRVAIIHQPWSVIDPPVTSADSIALWTDQVAQRLAQVCDVTCYCRLFENQPAAQSVNGIEYRRFSVSIDRWIRGGFEKLDELGLRRKERPFYASALCYRQFISGVIQDVKRLNPDIVHIQNFSQFVPLIREALPETEIILHMHAEWLAQIDDAWIGPRLREADSILFCSNFFASQTCRSWPQYAGRCRTVYNGVTLSEFANGPDAATVERQNPKRLLFAGRISPDKGVHVLVDAFAQVLARHPTAELKIVGPFATLPKSFCLSMALEPIVQDLARFYGRPYVDQLRERMTPATAKQIELVGAISRPELVNQFKQAGVLVLPSIYPEGFGIPIIEAGACFAPAVCTHRGGMPEVVEDGKTGLLVEAGDVNALAAALNQLLDDESLRRSMGEAAHQRVVENFTWDRIANSLLAEYCRLAGRVTETCARIVSPRPTAPVSPVVHQVVS